jgi:dienelactone hydrolase
MNGFCTLRLHEKIAIESLPIARLIAVGCLIAGLSRAQTNPRQLAPILEETLQAPAVTAYQLRQYLMNRVPPLPSVADAGKWTAEAGRIRRHLLDDVVFHGWPPEWVNASPKFVSVEVLEGKGYRIRKLRYEIVPGFQSVALLYEPEHLDGRMPAILNVNGHERLRGKAVEYKQKRCINFARHGILALSLEWLACGELKHAENEHDFAAHLDLIGMNGAGLFYLAMRRGLDFLDEHPNVDRTRLGVTGLSGGGWQTITLSALDERVTAAVPVAGFAGLVTSIEHPEYIGDDIEQNATDFRDGQDYTHLVAMRAPRPTLLIYNAEDDCCFRGPLVKPHVFDAITSYFKLYGREDALSWYENRDPGTHNYQLDNRQQAYRFFGRNFNLPALGDEIPVDGEIKTYEALAVGLPKDNLTILGLARQRARLLTRQAPQTSGSQREKLGVVVRYRPVTVKHAWAVGNTKNKGLETRSFQFQMSNDLSAIGVLAQAITTPDAAPTTIVLNDKGKKAASDAVSDAVNRGERVLALDLLLLGDGSPENPGSPEYAQLLSATGDRLLGMQAAQLVAIAQWLHNQAGATAVRVESTGLRSQSAALVAAALQPSLFSALEVHDGIQSFQAILDKPVSYASAPELFCLDLYRYFDIDLLMELAGLKQPGKVR